MHILGLDGWAACGITQVTQTEVTKMTNFAFILCIASILFQVNKKENVCNYTDISDVSLLHPFMAWLPFKMVCTVNCEWEYC